MTTLRAHMRELHLRVKLPRANADVVSAHKHDHHNFKTNHVHEGENIGPGRRPPGWTTGEGVIMRAVTDRDR